MKKIKLIIRVDGTCSIDALNFTDATCTRATRQILDALAGQVTQDRLKPEAGRLPPLARGESQPEVAR